MPIWLIILLVIVILLIVVLFSKYNSLVVLKNKVEDQFSQIDIQLKRRADLIPNLVETIKGYTDHESKTLESIISARNKYLSSDIKEDKIKNADKLNSSVNKLFALAESYPDLKASKNFEELQKQLSETEDKISYARQFYNDTVLMYNNKVKMFPDNLIASIFGFKSESFFEATKEEKKNIKVSFKD